MGGGTRYSTPDQAIAAKTARDGDCLIWTGATRRDGYGVTSINNKMAAVHRYVWERSNGPIPEGMQVDHICHRRNCVNLAHLRLATHKQNNEHRTMSRNNKSGYRGVCWEPRRKKWVVQVTHNRRVFHVGYFDTVEEAGEAARLKRLELYTHNNLDRVA